MNFKQLLSKTTTKIKKNSPAILTGLGIVGLGATAYLAYKSREKVEIIVEDLEHARDNDIEIDKVELAKSIADAVYAPVTVGALSVAAILWSYKIQSRRITSLAGALVAQQARTTFLENKYKRVHGEEEYAKFITPTEEVVHEGEGRKKATVEDVKQEVDKTIGQWYDESTEYVSDDHTYNLAMIDSIDERLQTILFQRGSLLLNEVREALGFERIRPGALLGWTAGDSFNITKVVTAIRNAEGEANPQIWVTWSTPRYIYDEIDFNGRYAVNAI